MTPHKHYEVIVAFAEGRLIESIVSGAWVVWRHPWAPDFCAGNQYRVHDEYREWKEAYARGAKLEVFDAFNGLWRQVTRPSWAHEKGPAGYRIAPKPDYIETGWLETRFGVGTVKSNVNVTYDGATGKVKHVEIIQ